MFSKHAALVPVFLCSLTFAQLQIPSSGYQSISYPDVAAQGKIAQNYGKLPLSFEANQGQTDERVKFLSRGSGYTLFLTGDEAVFSLRESKADGKASPANPHLKPTVATAANAVLRMKLLHANPAAKITGTDQLQGKSNYFIGNDPKRWRSNVPTYAKVRYEGIYSGIDLVYYGNQRRLEYDFVVAPSADPRHIQFDIRGVKSIRRDSAGDLKLETGTGELGLRKPTAYQEKEGRRQEIAARYVFKQKNRVGFELAKYDTSKPLFIDPLVYSTFLGGSGGDYGEAIAVDSSGNAYVAGGTTSTNFPTMNPLQPALAGGENAFVAKLNPSGSALVYSTYLGGNLADGGSGIDVDSLGDAYVTGITFSTTFPTTTGAFQTILGGVANAFVTEINPAGSALVYSTYLGGSNEDYGAGIAADSGGNAYVAGATCSTNFPVTAGAFQTQYGGGGCEPGDAFVTKINSTGSALVYSSYLGGSDYDYANGIALDSAGDAYVTGATYSANFPTVNPLQPTYGGDVDAFVTEMNPTGSALVYSTYLGGSGNDLGSAIAVDSSGDVYVTGYTESTNFPTMNPFQPANAGTRNAFVSEIKAEGTAFLYSTYLGGSNIDEGGGIAVDGSGNAYVTGGTTSTNFPTLNPLQVFYGGNTDAFVAMLNSSGSALTYSTYLGGNEYDGGTGIAVDSAGDAYVVGETSSANFPTMNPLQPNYGGGASDAFMAKIAQPVPTTITIASSVNPAAVNQLVALTGAVVAQNGGTPTGTVTFYNGATAVGLAALNSAGQATFDKVFPVAGTKSITAAYSGDANFVASASPIYYEGVGGHPAVVTLTSNLNPAPVGQTVTLNATVSSTFGSPTGTVSFIRNGVSIGRVTLVAGQASLNYIFGSTTTKFITAVYSGNVNFETSTSPVLTQLVTTGTGIASSTVLSSNSNPTYGFVTFTATVTSTQGSPTGTVTFWKNETNLIGTAPLNSGMASATFQFEEAGQKPITAIYSGDANFSPSVGALTQTVLQ